jgi:hypothetical protein
VRLQLFGCDQIGEKREADASPLDAHQFVEQGKSVQPDPAGREKISAFEGHLGGIGHSKRHAGTTRLQHAERSTKSGAAE